MLKIKVSGNIPSTNIKDKNGFSSISKFLPNSLTSYKDCQFFVNENIKSPDYWIIIDDLIIKSEACDIDPSKIFFLSAEVPFVTSYFYDKSFLSQFQKIFSSHAIYNDKNITTLPFLPFMINAGHGKSIFEYDEKYNYDNLLKNNAYKKTKTLSIIASSKGGCKNKVTPFHEARYYFAIKIKEKLKDKIDLFGYGHNEIKSKSEAIEPYKYHICLENQSTPNVITEKLYDSYLGLSYPIYWGASNVHEYFPNKSLSKINIFNFKESLDIIESAIEGNLFEKNINSIIKGKELVLKKYGVFQRIEKICSDDHKNNSSNNKKITTIYNRDSFFKVDKSPIYIEKKKVKLKRKLTLLSIFLLIIYSTIITIYNIQ